MTMYRSRFSYTPETWARMIEKPEDRREAARSYIESGVELWNTDSWTAAECSSARAMIQAAAKAGSYSN